MESRISQSEPERHVPDSSRFTAQASTAEDIVKSQTVGLVQLSDFRKRRAQAFEQTERETSQSSHSYPTNSSAPSGASTPGAASSNGTLTPNDFRPKKKKKKSVQKNKLTFGSEDEDEVEALKPKTAKSAPSTSDSPLQDDGTRDRSTDDNSSQQQKRLGPNASIAVAPKAMTKSAQRKAAEARDQLRQEFLVMQEAVKAVEIVIPFVFYDGTNLPGGACKIKKGDPIWLFLDRSRKVGAELGVGGSEKAGSKREWARISVDDLMLVRGDIIIPQHFEVYYFIVNQVKGSNGEILFDYATTTDKIAKAPDASTVDDDYDPLSLPGQRSRASAANDTDESKLEGAQDDPTFTKVVDRRWYERNKHLFPASTWQDYDAAKDYTKDVRKDNQGNTFFF